MVPKQKLKTSGPHCKALTIFGERQDSDVVRRKHGDRIAITLLFAEYLSVITCKNNQNHQGYDE